MVFPRLPNGKMRLGVAFRIIWRNVSELFGVVSALPLFLRLFVVDILGLFVVACHDVSSASQSSNRVDIAEIPRRIDENAHEQSLD
jgi:hypothetical protein